MGAHEATIRIKNLPAGQVCSYNLNLKNQEQGQMIKLSLADTAGYSYALYYNNLIAGEQTEVGQSPITSLTSD